MFIRFSLLIILALLLGYLAARMRRKPLLGICAWPCVALSASVTSVTVAPTNVILSPTETRQYAAVCHYSDHADDDCAGAGGVTWRVSDRRVGSITAGGLLTAATHGNYLATYVEATAGPVYGRAYLGVTPRVGETITAIDQILPLNDTVPVGATLWASARVKTSQNLTVAATRLVNWTSSDPAIASVDWEGHITAVAPGTATITATAQNVTRTTTLTVTAAAENPSPKTWYVRPGGGTRYHPTRNPNGQCDGLHDADYPGSGVNRPCAYSSWKWLWLDGASRTWAISGGDTVILRQNPNGAGNNTPGPCNNGEYDCGYDVGYGGWSTTGTSYYTCAGSGQSACTNPPIPSGTPTQHTRILGENFASCGRPGAKTTLYGVINAQSVLNLASASYVDVQCIGISDRSGCMSGGPAGGFSCTNGVDSYSKAGVAVGAATTNINFADVDIHGIAASGWIGMPGDGITLTRVRNAGNHSAGFNLDPGGSYAQGGGLVASQLLVEWNGCEEQYPVVNPLPYANCTDQSNAGYGDGVGTADTGGVWSFDSSVFRYNTQDGLDLLHVSLPGSAFSVTNSSSYGNMGQQFKLGTTSNVVFRNNETIGSCRRLSAPMGGAPENYNQFLTDYCRANGTAIAMTVSPHSTFYLQQNTWTGNANIQLDIECSGDYGGDTTGDCTGAKIYLQNNIMRGYRKGYGQDAVSTGIYMGNGGALGPIFSGTRDHNVFYHLKTGLETDCNRGYPGELCAAPAFVSEADDAAWEAAFDQSLWDRTDLRLRANSPAVDAGASLPAVTTDRRGGFRPQGAGFDIGAHEFPGGASPNILTAFVPQGLMGHNYTGRLDATGDSPITWSLVSGSFLPPWATLNPETGVISGRPNAPGAATFTVRATNAAGATDQTLTLAISASPIPRPTVRGRLVRAEDIR